MEKYTSPPELGTCNAHSNLDYMCCIFFSVFLFSFKISELYVRYIKREYQISALNITICFHDIF
jgi:hypothetical protein